MTDDRRSCSVERSATPKPNVKRINASCKFRSNYPQCGYRRTVNNLILASKYQTLQVPGKNNDRSIGRSNHSWPSSLPSAVYGSAFSPPSKYGSGKKYLVVCSSGGCIYVWDSSLYDQSVQSYDHQFGDSREKAELSSTSKPMFCVTASDSTVEKTRLAGHKGGTKNYIDNALYDLRFISCHTSNVFLVASGDLGIFLYKWSDFEAVIDVLGDQSTSTLSLPKGNRVTPRMHSSFFYCHSSEVPIVKINPVSIFHPHPSPTEYFGEVAEINSTSYDTQNDILYGASGDDFLCYQWDLSTETLLGTFGDLGACRKNYLLTMETIPEHVGGSFGSWGVVTGGEDGKVGFWDGKQRKPIEMISLQHIINYGKNTIQPEALKKCTANNFNSLWVSSMSMNHNWLAVCGGIDCGSNNVLKYPKVGGSGFISLWHLPTRTFAHCSLTRDRLSEVAYSPPLDQFISGGNEGRISFWSSLDLANIGHSWSNRPATYTISVCSCSGLMAVGGVGSKIDCYMGHTNISQLNLS